MAVLTPVLPDREPDASRYRWPTVGVLGGGQLARMMAEAAIRLGGRLLVYQTADEGPSDVVPKVFTGAWDDAARLQRFLARCDAVTLDNEWVDLSTVAEILPPHTPLWPSPRTMHLVGDKVRQKEHARSCNLPVGPFEACADADSAERAARRFGFPVVVKRPTHGYDGYGNRTAHEPAALRAAVAELGAGGQVLIEQWVPFTLELAVIVARRADGETVAYPVASTRQRDHKCEAVEVPAPIPEAMRLAATEIALQAAEAFACVGVVGVELFALADGTLLLNEIAPRPHNTGHFSIDACVTSQFENHLRAVVDLPLGDPSLLAPAAVMVNVLGRRQGQARRPDPSPAFAIPGTSVHLYGKRFVRPGRKMGHVTAVGHSIEEARARAYAAANALEF